VKNTKKDDMLFLVKIHWVFGNWDELTTMVIDDVSRSSHREIISLLVASAFLNVGNSLESSKWIGNARSWGATDDDVKRMLLSDIYYSMARITALVQDFGKSSYYFEESTRWLEPDLRLVVDARSVWEYADLGILSQASKILSFVKSSRQDQKSEQNYLSEKFLTKSLLVDEFNYKEYWDKRYRAGGDSGKGSTGKLLEFKLDFIVSFLKRHELSVVVDYGCGDAKLLDMGLSLDIKYTGIDASEFIVEKNKKKYANANIKFVNSSEYKFGSEKFEVSLSIDVLYHIINIKDYTEYMYNLFNLSSKFVIIYSATKNDLPNTEKHIKIRDFRPWIKEKMQGWTLFDFRKNLYPYDTIKSTSNSSISNFYVYKKVR